MHTRNARPALFFSFLALFMLGCGQESAQGTPAPPNVFKEQREVLDQAKGVQDTVDRQAEEARQKLEAAEGGAKQ